jgi:uncharacterized protein (DUF58 family)
VSFLDPEVISRLESLALRVRVIAEGALTGLHRAHQRGSSVEFAEYKEYSEGDDPRHIDWRVYAKADRYVIKQFEQETELSAHLVLDASGSMAYRSPEGTLSKVEYAAHLIGALAYILIRQRDKAGLLVFGDRKLERHVPPRARPAHLHDLLAVIEGAMDGGGGDESVAAALERAGELAGRKRGMVVIATDFFDVEQERALAALKHLRARGHDVVLFHLLDPDELGLPFDGLTRFVSLESPRELLASANAIRREYLKRLAAFLDDVAEACTDAGVDYVPTPTGRPIEETLAKFLARRSGQAASRGVGAGTTIGDAWTF